MDILDEYAIKIGKSPKQLKDDYFSSSEEEQLELMSHIMQTGGVNMPTEQAPMSQQEDEQGAMVMQIIQMYAQATEQDPTTIIEQLQEMSPEQQEQAIQQMAATLQEQPQMQMGGEVDEKESWIISMLMKYAQETEQVPEDVLRQFSEMSEDEQTLFLEEIEGGEQMQTGGYDDVSMRGYSDDSPYRYNPYNRIQSNKITMGRTGMDLIGVSDTGDVQYMPAYSGDYEFDGDEVMEYPVYQTFDDGLDINELKRQLDALKNTKKKFKTKKEENIFNTVLREKQASFNSIKELYRKANNSNYQNEAEKYIDEANKRLEYFKTISVENYQEIPSPAGEGLPDFRFIDRKPGTQKKSNAVPPANTSNNKGFNVTYDNGVTEPLKEVSPGVYTNPKGSTWTRGEDGKFKFEANPFLTNSGNKSTTNTPPPNRGGNSGGRKGSGKNKGKETPKTKLPNFDLTFLQKPYYGEPTDADILNDLKSVPGIFDAPATTETQRANMVGMGPEKGNGIQYSPKIDGITPERPKPKTMFKYNTTNSLSDIFDASRVVKAYSPANPGYFRDIDFKTPELLQYDPRAGLQAINDSYSAIKGLINPNSAVGMAASSSLASKQADDSLKYVNSIEQQNMQLKNQHQTMVADLYNKVNAERDRARYNYVDDWQKVMAVRDANIDRVQGRLEEKFANNRYQNALIDNTIQRNPYITEVTKGLDSALGKRVLAYDSEAAIKNNLKVQEDKKTQEDLLANVTRLIQQMNDEKAAAKTAT